MAANKFATMLHRNTNKISIILIYAVLEWILIILLLLNSLFSHLIERFANYFGLKPPCPWCSRIDNCSRLATNTKSYQDLVCEFHAAEISKLAYCTKHKKLAKCQFMCRDCSFSQPRSPRGSADIEQKIAFLSSIADKKIENGESEANCSCCDVSLSSDLYPPYLLFSEKRENEERDEGNEVVEEHKILSYADEIPGIHGSDKENLSPSVSQCKEIEINEDDIVDTTETAEKDSTVLIPDSPTEGMDFILFPEDNTKRLSTSSLKLENWSDFDDHFLITIEPIDSMTFLKEKSGTREASNGQSGDLLELINSETIVHKQDYSMEGNSITSELPKEVHFVEERTNKAQEVQLDMWEPALEYMNKAETKNSFVVLSKECNTENIDLLTDQISLTQATKPIPYNNEMLEAIEIVITDSDKPTGVDVPKSLTEREMPDQELDDQPRSLDLLPSFTCQQDENATSSHTFTAEDEQSPKETEEMSTEEKPSSVTKTEDHIDHHLYEIPETQDADEENATKITNHIEGLQHLPKKLLLEKKETGMEESMDGSFISESGEGVLTTEHLKLVLKEERKARCALYEELEAERSANAVAAKHTMEMITRLQEEKETMQMEALQYQRMMDEQSEYDQEALQLLNELVVKVEKEKHELQAELEINRKKLLHYEAKEKRRIKRKTTSELSRTYSASFSNSEDSDQLHLDFDHESADEDSCNGHPESSNNTPANGVINVGDMDLDSSKHMSILDESLADFEAEKLSILEKLKELEEKLFTLSDEEGEYFEDIKPIVLFAEENTQTPEDNGDFNIQELNSNGSSKEPEKKKYENGNTSHDMNGFHLDTNGVDTFNVAPNEQSTTVLSQKEPSNSKFMAVNKRLAIEEEVDNVYERLHALEADREFLKQSISSLRKGDKGMDLLQEILQYLRDLRSVELCTKKIGDASVA